MSYFHRLMFFRCSSWVGRDTRVPGGEHPISLDSGCWWKATVMHEIAHSLGRSGLVFHEEIKQTRFHSHQQIL